MKNLSLKIIVGLLFITTGLNAQIININNAADPESLYGPEQLIKKVLIDSDCAQVDSFKEQVFGNPTDTILKSYGYFKRPVGNTSFPFKEGVILTSGNAYKAGNHAVSLNGGTGNSIGGDSDLEKALGLINTNDATYIKFNFVAVSSTISFRYLMASSEYNKSFECKWADGFAFLLREVGESKYKNLAVIAETSTPVSTTNVHPQVTGTAGCPAINETYFKGYDLGDTNYGGRTKVLTATATVVPNQTYEIKLVMADWGDSSYDSAVFLEAGSFSLDIDLGAPKLTATNNAACGASFLLDANIAAASYEWFFNGGAPIPDAIGQTYLADKGDGIYKVIATLAAGCLAEDEIEIEFSTAPVATQPANYQVCDGNNDGIETFDLTTKDADIKNGQTGVSVTYHTSFVDANASSTTNPITSPFNSGNTIIYARTESIGNTTCYDITNFKLEVFKTPTPLDSASITDLEVCDNNSFAPDTNGIVIVDLTQRATEILNGMLPAEFSLSYFTDNTYTAAAAISTPTAYQNLVSGGETIYVRVSNILNTACTTETSFELKINALPIISSLVELQQCDDDNDGVSLFNLTEANTYISKGLNEKFTYYLTKAKAETGLAADQITNFVNYPNPVLFNDVVYARIENTNGCFRTAQIDLVVGVSKIDNTFHLTYTVCDNKLIDGDKRNGIATFDFSDAEQQVKDSFGPPPHKFKVTFYNNEADALAEINPITDTSNHRNDGVEYSPTQNIYVRVDSDDVNGCLGLGHHITLNVESLPTANSVTFPRQCDDIPTDIEISSEFNTSNLESDLLLGQVGNVTVTYYHADGTPLTDLSGNPINSPFPALFRTTSQIITAKVVNNTTNTTDKIACDDATTIEFIVDITPVVNPVNITPACDDGVDDTDGFHEFDTATIEATLLGTQKGMNVLYTDGNGKVLSSPLPNPFNSNTQTITATIENPINPSCLATTTIDFVVNALPEFTVESPQIVCLNGPVKTLTFESQLEAYTYDWTDKNGNTIAIDSPSINVTTGGIYTITATNINNCKRSLDIEVHESIIADIDIDDVVIVDDSDNNTITINNDTNNLGVGDYEFSLDDGFFQDEPFFDHVKAGIHTINVRDKNDCGLAQLKVSVIGFPKFFTPNNDGYNDNWKVIGVNKDFFPTSLIYIFDRFGKLITQVSATGDGWNGIYNGTHSPSTDYWFTVQLVDKNGIIRVRKGHFSLIRKIN